jgi:hypothetical protein
MSWTRLSFLYLMSYLGAGGVALLAAPDTALRLLGATGDYSPILARFLGAFMVALGIIVLQIWRHGVQVLYPTTLLVRVVLLATIVWLYVESRDVLFLSLTGIVGLGMVLTFTGLVIDRGQSHHSSSRRS